MLPTSINDNFANGLVIFSIIRFKTIIFYYRLKHSFINYFSIVKIK